MWYAPIEMSERLQKALAMAELLHRDQKRKGTEIPYLSHLLGTAAIALEHGADEDQAIAALLHDAVEDQGGPETLALIKLKFGERVGLLVEACTDFVGEPKPPWKERKLAHIK